MGPGVITVSLLSEAEWRKGQRRESFRGDSNQLSACFYPESLASVLYESGIYSETAYFFYESKTQMKPLDILAADSRPDRST